MQNDFFYGVNLKDSFQLCKEKQIRKNDEKNLREKCGYSLTDLSDTFANIIHQACLSQLFSPSVITNNVVPLENGIAVEFSSIVYNYQDHCAWCSEITDGGGQSKLTNMNTGESIAFDAHNMHQIAEHQYYGSGESRVEPEELAGVIGFLIKKPL